MLLRREGWVSGMGQGLVWGLWSLTVVYCSGQLSLQSLACMDPLDPEVDLIGQEPGTSQKALGRLESMMLQERGPDGQVWPCGGGEALTQWCSGPCAPSPVLGRGEDHS